MAQCQAAGTTASAAVRGFVEMQIGAPAPKRSARLVRPALATGIVAAIGALLVVAPAASAPNFGPAFTALDKNRDGVINPAEYGDVRPHSFACDGPLAIPLKRAGLDKGPRPFAVRVDDAAFTTLDRDGDRQISRSEFVLHRLTQWHKGYASLDTDKDGTLSAAEYAGAKNIVFLGRQPDIASFAELDHDRDGRVTWREYLS